MAMNGNDMAAAVLTAIGGETTDIRTAAFQAMCNAIVAHIQANAQAAGTTASACTAGGATGTCVVPPGGIS